MGQGVKSIKDKVRETTFVMAEKNTSYSVDEFYTLKRAERGKSGERTVTEEKNIPQYLRSHWQKETGFPSGHDVCCQLGTAGRWFAVAASANVNHCYLAGLGNGVMGRLLLGMHCHAICCSVDFVGAGGGGNVACATNLWAIHHLRKKIAKLHNENKES